MPWRQYFETDISLYVSRRHREAHYQGLAEDLLAVIDHPPGTATGQTVLDYGCGEALAAPRVARRVRRLVLCDSSSLVRRNLAEHVGRAPNIEIIDTTEAASLPAGSLDFVALNSVLQYLDPTAGRALVATLAAKLAPGGRLLVGDIIPPGLGPVQDAVALLRFGARSGFLGAAVMGLVRTAFSDYARIRSRLGLTRYTAEDIAAVLVAAGLKPATIPNLGHNQHRLAVLGRRP